MNKILSILFDTLNIISTLVILFIISTLVILFVVMLVGIVGLGLPV